MSNEQDLHQSLYVEVIYTGVRPIYHEFRVWSPELFLKTYRSFHPMATVKQINLETFRRMKNESDCN